MDSELKSFENQWELAMKDASVPPPDIVWDNIERELDKEKKKRIAFIWWTNPAVLSGIAAALVIGLTFLFLNKKDAPESLSARVETNNGNTIIVTNSKENEKDPSEQILKSTEVIKESSSEIESNSHSDLAIVRAIKSIGIKNDKAGSSINKSKRYISRIKSENGIEFNSIEPAKPAIKTEFIASSEETKIRSGNIDIASLEAKRMKNIANRFLPLKPYISVEFDEAVAELKSSKNKLWFGLSSGVAPFAPNYSTNEFVTTALADVSSNAAFTNKSLSNEINNLPTDTRVSGLLPNETPQSYIKNGRSLNFGFSIGKKLKKHFGFESGLKIVQANAYLNSNVYAINEESGQVNSYFQANYLNNASGNTQTILSVNETTKQLYNYVSLPMLLNYSVPIFKDFGVEAIGGLSGDMFVFGKFDNNSESKAKLTAANSTFNLLNMSGLGGLRLNYKITKVWEANIGSTYQKAMISGVSSEQNLSYKPRMFGINYGVRYKMQ
jgi:hypothetical protein